LKPVLKILLDRKAHSKAISNNNKENKNERHVKKSFKYVVTECEEQKHTNIETYKKITFFLK
jgi:hypothetical protein